MASLNYAEYPKQLTYYDAARAAAQAAILNHKLAECQRVLTAEGIVVHSILWIHDEISFNVAPQNQQRTIEIIKNILERDNA